MMGLRASLLESKHPVQEQERKTAVIDLGSNSFRLVAFSYVPDSWWRRSDEIYDAVRIGEGTTGSGRLQPEPTGRALAAITAYNHFCSAMGIESVRAVATSAIRDAENRDEFIDAAERATDLTVEVLSSEDEAYYGYLAAANSTTLKDGAVLDLGGGSMQLVEVKDRLAGSLHSWPLGSVRTTERFLPDKTPTPKQLKELRRAVTRTVGEAEWFAPVDRLVGIGGTLRNLAAAAQAAEGLPSLGVQGFELTRTALEEIVERLAALPPQKRGSITGIKPERGDIILAGAVTVAAVLEAGKLDSIEVTEAGLREGVFFASYLDKSELPLVENVRTASVLNLAHQYYGELTHPKHVAKLSLEIFGSLAELGVHSYGQTERELLWAAAMLHDIGVTVDYDDHHRHSRYLILNAGLPGFTPRETALIAQMARYHRKGTPKGGWLEPLFLPGDRKLLERCSAILRIAEQLERSRDQAVSSVTVSAEDGTVSIELSGPGDLNFPRWAAQRKADAFAKAFDVEVKVL